MESLSAELVCPICLDLYDDPMMLSCGHNFCQECINLALDSPHGSTAFKCPECNAVFLQRPALQRNLKLRNIVQHLQKASHDKLQHSLLELNREQEDTEKRLHSLNEQKSKIQESSQALEIVLNTFFTMIEKDIRRSRKIVLGEISRKKEHALAQVSKFMEELELRKQELSRKVHETQERLLGGGALVTSQLEPEVEDRKLQSDSVAIFWDEAPISLTFKRGLSGVVHMFSELIKTMPEPKTLDVILDVKTACKDIQVSPDCRSASNIGAHQGHPEGPERFTVCQLLSTCNFSTQNYWKVDVSKAEEWIIGVAYHSMGRKALTSDAYIGYNNKSWSLECRQSLSALHNNVRQEVTVKSPVKLLGVYVNYESGLISFYQLNDQFRHLFSFSATFTERLHAAFCVFPNGSITIPKRKTRAKRG
ncbi:E3 ubiquitin-protein ligase TRIM62-like [Dendrobates tinctorius]|uniref:E3 ubiquitin-protein ligase TRIM62-like n=1 Tax=Dendrobates tinctorius TaxID=92724 RepID=UPI003CCA2C7E